MISCHLGCRETQTWGHCKLHQWPGFRCFRINEKERIVQVALKDNTGWLECYISKQGTAFCRGSGTKIWFIFLFLPQVSCTTFSTPPCCLTFSLFTSWWEQFTPFHAMQLNVFAALAAVTSLMYRNVSFWDLVSSAEESAVALFLALLFAETFSTSTEKE